MSACQSGGDASRRAVELSDPALQEAAGLGFDGEAALADWTRLREVGQRTTGSRAAGRARSHIRGVLRKAGFDADDVETPIEWLASDGTTRARNATHVVGRRAGAAEDVILLVAPYDSASGGADDARGDSASADASDARGDAGQAGSGAALLLEMARLHERLRDEVGEQPFGLVLVFVDGDALGRRDFEAGPAESHPGSDAFARWWLAREDSPPVRLLIWLDRVGAVDVEIARDLDSNRAYRETFFDIGTERGLLPAFDASRPLSSPDTGHRAFVARGFSPVVALVGVADGGVAAPSAEPSSAPSSATPGSPTPGSPAADSAAAPLASAGFDAVGEATWWGLARISDRLARIDAFRVDPLGSGPGLVVLPGADGSPAPGAAAPPLDERGGSAEAAASD